MFGLLLAMSTLMVSVPATSSEPAIDVYTFGPGAPLFERFGHAAVCVTYDTDAQRTRCYNYGTTDFGSPPQEIGLDFLLGRARFWVSVSPLDRMLASYTAADRTIWRQRLPLSETQVARAVAKLEHDAQPAHREYVYHHLQDNCSTRVRDLASLVTGEALTGREPSADSHATFRSLAGRALGDQPLLIAVADVFVGRSVDRAPDAWESMFLPDALRETITRRLGVAPELVYRRRAPLPAGRGGSWPVWLGIIAVSLVLLAAPMAAQSRRRLADGFDRIGASAAALAGALIGLAGVGLWTVAAVTTVPELRWNEALLVFVPFDLALPFLSRKARARYARWRTVGLLATSALSAANVLKQPLLLPTVAVVLPFLAMLAAARRRTGSESISAGE